MLLIKAQNKATNSIEEFSPAEWYNVQQSGNFTYIGTIFKDDQPKVATTSSSTPTVKRGCGCGKKK